MCIALALTILPRLFKIMTLNRLLFTYDYFIAELNLMGIDTREEDIEEVWEEVLGYFNGSIPKTLMWLAKENSIFQGRKPIDMIANGKVKELKKFLQDAFNSLVQ